MDDGDDEDVLDLDAAARSPSCPIARASRDWLNKIRYVISRD